MLVLTKHWGSDKMNGDILRCKVCLLFFKDVYPDFQHKVRQNCPWCGHSGYWNISRMDKKELKKVYRFGSVFHLEYLDKLRRLGVGIPDNSMFIFSLRSLRQKVRYDLKSNKKIRR